MARILLATTCRWFSTARLALALKEAGFELDAVCPPRHPLALTNSINRIYRFRSLNATESIARAAREANPDWLIPCDDLATLHLHKLHPEIPILIERSLGPVSSFSTTVSRHALLALARDAGIDVAETEPVASLADLDRSTFPAVLKADGTSGGLGVKIVQTLDEARSAFRKLHAPPLVLRAVKRAIFDYDTTLLLPCLRRQRPTITIQRCITGHDATSAVVCRDGRILAMISVEVLRSREEKGPASVIRVIDQPEMKAAAEKIIGRLKLSGFYGFDYMIDDATGKPYLIEMNPRSTQTCHLALGPDHDLPATLLASFTGNAIKPRPLLTNKDLLALFPNEWLNDAASSFLQTAYHDVPWQAPELVRASINSRPVTDSWFSSARWVEIYKKATDG